VTVAGAEAPRIDHYDWAGGREAMLRFGPAEAAATVVVALPLLEEANRTRALAVAVLRMLATRRIAGVLPELPGTGESVVPTEAMRLADLREAFLAARERIGGGVVALSIRSGALLVTPAQGRGDAGRWSLSPQTGVEVVREWQRLRSAGDGVTVAGNRIAAALCDDLAGAEPLAARVLRLEGDPRPADRVIAAPPPWRRAEPEADLSLAALLAEDIADWIARCDG